MKESANIEMAQGRPVLHAVLNRRDNRTFLEKNIPKLVAEELLYASTWAPNHRLTEPWRFIAFSEEKRQEFIELYLRSIMSLALDEKSKEKAERKVEKAKKDYNKCPLIVVAAYLKDTDPIVDQENLITVSCGLQNMLLTAEELGIGAHWSSGAAVRSEAFHKELGFNENEEIIGLFQMGYVSDRGRMKRSLLDKFLIWK